MTFEVIGEIESQELIAKGTSIRELKRLERVYGKGQWRKLKGRARVRFSNGTIRLVEIHWYEAHGIGKKEFKIKHILENS
ncbi:MAG: hypothetical protein JRJ13_08540 [Deltaproteobacteria bacterium]|nr:hypothetical protein [Deltaproteobacteria bacterium]MBW1929184.1 hypothetical protein [Deltaproteobacteria bacterium]RLB17465.1 MAG: hypothetical protein DRG63_03750 [Deltaproteobacteria bacterium]